MMVTARSVAACLVVLMSVPSVLLGQSSGYYVDGFEATVLSTFWTPFTSSGTVTMPSTVQVHGGNQSLQLSTFDTPNVNKAAGVLHPFSPATYGKASVWLYDTGADVSSSSYLSLHTGPFAIGTWDYDLGPGNNGSTYAYTAPGASGATAIDRTLGWHHFVIRTSAAASSLEIDGITIYSGPGGTALPEVQLEMHAPAWRPPFTAYFDDFAFDPCDGQPCGQSNSVCATLIVNGAGASGHGPFWVAAPAETYLSLSWQGSPNQPIVLAQASDFLVGQNLGGGLVIDLDLAAWTIILSGLEPGGFWFATNAAGSASQVFSVPTALAGTIARVQGGVFDAMHSCSGTIGLMTTASFEIQF